MLPLRRAANRTASHTYPHDVYAALAATLDAWLAEFELTRLLFDSLEDMHAILLLHAAYSGCVDVVDSVE
ncbi:hypothetical protein H257_11540 [Aphanomyces astaci]|uniref:Uncharacterized protein n=1 Tax=Aphanomyces astaci TaxID=112090 RepID=W4G4J9_APHAT|nr:hypothetical protein H257_11540 [Aphanomyces astaci]ETV73883.1 hypothetical protein H257_11540 [Aphanomyces astaci]|eukprot:XP_009836819.1 hypothetical protein H257_11540 [Aphanomyces astaci]